MDLRKNSGSGEDGEEKKQAAPGAKPNQAKQLLLLLILLGGFGYVYFFTDLIRALPPAVKPSAPPSQAIRKTLPPREAAPTAAAVEKVADKGKVADADKAATASPQKNVAAETKVPPAPVASQKPAPKTSVKDDSGSASSSPTGVIKNNVKMAAVEKGEEKKTAPKSAAPAEGKEPARVSASGAAQPALSAKKKAVLQKPAEKEKWSIIAGGYLLESEMSSDIAKIKKAGFNPSVIPGNRIKTKMNRLFAGEFENRASALAQLDKLKRVTPDAFMLEHGGKFSVYAGSYLLADRAGEELERLVRGGFAVTLRKTDVNLPSKALLVGVFSGREKALEVRSKLAAAGVSRLSVVNR